MVCFSMKVASPYNRLVADCVIKTIKKTVESLVVVNWILLCLSWAAFLLVELGETTFFYSLLHWLCSFFLLPLVSLPRWSISAPRWSTADKLTWLPVGKLKE